jgi:hypothetical protein
MFTINEFLGVLGLKRIHSVDEFDLSEFMLGLIKLDKKKNPTLEETLVINYYL